MAGLTLLACLIVMTIIINILLRVCRKRGLLRTKG
jgi:hypothetical protein